MKTVWVRGLAVLLAAASLSTLGSGCAGEDDAQVIGRNMAPIRDGFVDEQGLFPHVFALVAEVPTVNSEGDPAVSFSLCSGTLIAPNLLLTAQHCVAELEEEFILCLGESFGDMFPTNRMVATNVPAISGSIAQSQVFGVSRVLIPEESREICGYDIALVELSRNVPDTVARPIAPRLDVPPAAQEPYTAVGYGDTGDGEGMEGTRRYRGELSIRCFGPDCPSVLRLTDTEIEGDRGTCSGDSGGPMLDEDGLVLGALSRGAIGCSTSTWAAVYPWADWIRGHAADAADNGGYEPAAWVRPAGGDGCIGDGCDEVGLGGGDLFDCSTAPATATLPIGALALILLLVTARRRTCYNVAP